MRQAIHAAAALLGPCWSVSHLAGGRGQVFRIVAGHPERVQDILAEEARRRLQAAALHRLRTLLWRGTIPGRATRCRASRCCFIIARPADQAACWPDYSGLTRTRSTARSRSAHAQVHRRDGEIGRLDHSAAFAAGAPHRQGGRIAGGLHDALGVRAGG